MRVSTRVLGRKYASKRADLFSDNLTIAKGLLQYSVDYNEAVVSSDATAWHLKCLTPLRSTDTVMSDCKLKGDLLINIIRRRDDSVIEIVIQTWRRLAAILGYNAT